MPWGEFKQLLQGISPETALGRIVSIRAENNKEVLKNFTPEQRRIRSEWRRRSAKDLSEADMDRILDGFKQAFISMSGSTVKKAGEE